ncbi:hypothetical protein FA821_13285 [Salmonella enterica]|nr:hypothetical protein [Salmonella enterica]
MPKALTNEIFLERMGVKTFTPLTSYIDCKTKIHFRCNVCNHEWFALPSNILKDHGCPKCSFKRNGDLLRKNHADYLERITDLHITPLEEYQKSAVKILHQCNICQHQWLVAPHKILLGRKCPVCALKIRGKKRALTPIEYNKRIESTTLEVLGEYKNLKQPLLHRCKVCGYSWEAQPKTILENGGCPACAFYGFNPSLIGYLYFLISEDGSLIKIGITNFYDQRIKSLEKATPFKFRLLHKITAHGQSIINRETDFHRRFKKSQAKFDQKFDGYTEWFYMDDEIKRLLAEIE